MSLSAPQLSAAPISAAPKSGASAAARHSTARRFAGAALWSVVLRVVGTGAMFVAQLALARWLGAEQFGEYVVILSCLSILALVAKGGWEAGTLKFVAEYVATQQDGSLAGFRNRRTRRTLALVVVATLIAVLLWPWLAPATTVTLPLVVMLLAAIALLALSDLASADLRARQRVLQADAPVLVLRPLLAVGMFGGLLWFGWAAATSTAALATFVVASGIAWLALHTRLPRTASQAAASLATHDEQRWRSVLGPLWWISVCTVILQQADVVLLGLFVDASSAGVYSAAARIARVIPLGLTAINAVGSPLLAEQFAQHDHPVLQRLARLMAWSALLVTLPTAAAAILLGPWILRLFGSEFTSGYFALVVLVGGQVGNGLTGSVGQLLAMTGQQSLSARILTCFAGVQLVLSCILIPWLGIVGAALATTVTLVGWNVALALVVRRNLGINATVFGSWPKWSHDRP
jgi:O-antigen/teichoic acid export membrane protein